MRCACGASYVCVCVCVQGLPDRLVERFPDWRLDVGTITVSECWLHKSTDKLSHFKAALSQLASLRAPEADIQFARWQWNTDMVQAVAEAAPTLQHLSLSVKTASYHALTDEQLSIMVQLAEHMPSLHTGNLQLQSDQHASVAWPWDELGVWELDLADLCKLPDPGAGCGADEGVWVKCEKLTIDCGTI